MRYLLALVLVLAFSNAPALTCLVPPIEDRYAQSKYVLLVKIIDARVEECVAGVCSPPRAPREEIEITSERRTVEWAGAVANVHVVESFKGVDPPTQLRISNWGNAPYVTVGAEYLVYTNDANVSQDCGGMTMISGLDHENQTMLRELRGIKRSSESRH
jgi:hypothetical protein